MTGRRVGRFVMGSRQTRIAIGRSGCCGMVDLRLIGTKDGIAQVVKRELELRLVPQDLS